MYDLLDLQAEGAPTGLRKVRFPVLVQRKFSRENMSDIRAMNENEYFRPTFPNFKSVESFVIVRKSVLFPGAEGLCIVAFQATVEIIHDLKRAGLLAIKEKVNEFLGSLEMYEVFVTSYRSGISKRQKLEIAQHADDLNFHQCVLYGMEFDMECIRDVEEGEESAEEEEE